MLKIIVFLIFSAIVVAEAFIQVDQGLNPHKAHMSALESNETPCDGKGAHPFSMLPGDPSLILTTNVDLGDKKLEIMKGTFGAKTAKWHEVF